jgi:hypothetical protein
MREITLERGENGRERERDLMGRVRMLRLMYRSNWIDERGID